MVAIASLLVAALVGTARVVSGVDRSATPSTAPVASAAQASQPPTPFTPSTTDLKLIDVSGLSYDEIKQRLKDAAPSRPRGNSSNSITREPNWEFIALGVDLTGRLTHTKRNLPVDCVWQCYDNASGCFAMVYTSFEGGTCWFKYEIGVRKLNTDAIAYVLYPEGDRDTYLFESFPNCDIRGFDIGNERASAASACPKACAANSACWAYTWTNYNGGTCWLKSRGADSSPYAGGTCGFMWRRELPVDFFQRRSSSM